MKKTLITFVVLGFVGSFAYAQNSTTLQDFSKENLTRIVSLVLELNKEGHSKDEIVGKILKNREDFAPIKSVKAVKAVKVEIKKDSTVNFGQYKKLLRKGDDNEDVKEMQEKLNKIAKKLQLPFGEIEADGKYGPATAAFVRLFQLQYHLDADGIIGPQTFKKFDELDDDEDELNDLNDDQNDDEEDDDQNDDDEEDDD